MDASENRLDETAENRSGTQISPETPSEPRSETARAVDALLADLVEPIRRDMDAAQRLAKRMLQCSDAAALRHWHCGRQIDQAYRRVEAKGYPKGEVYRWAREQLGYGPGRVSEARRLYQAYKTEDAVEGMTLDEAKKHAGIPTRSRPANSPKSSEGQQPAKPKPHEASKPDHYPIAREVTDQQMDGLSIKLEKFHGEWNYTIHPK